MSFLTSLVQRTEKNKKIQMLKQGVFSPLDELFYNKLPAGVRKPEINGFWLQTRRRHGLAGGCFALGWKPFSMEKAGRR